MRIGILTYHCVPNFGAQLQALSTVGCLRRMGHDPVVLHWYPFELEDIYCKGRVPTAQIRCHEEFTANYLPVTKLCRTEDDLISVVDEEHLDGLIAGSDAIFKYCPNVPTERLDNNPFFGAFLGKLARRIPAATFAVSTQGSDFMRMSPKERTRMRSMLANYCFFSVRDEWTEKMVRYVTGEKNVKLFPDPVFAFNYNAGSTVLSKERVLEQFGLPEKYILLSFGNYCVDDSYVAALATAFTRIGLEPVALTMPEGLRDFGLKTVINLPLSPIEWYSLIAHSSGFVGERLHPIIVCIHNTVPFFSFDEYGVMRSVYFARKKFWKPVWIHDWKYSKTFQLLSRAGLSKNWYSYHSNHEFPSVTTVVDCIKRFDCDRCRLFADSYRELYEMGMLEVIGYCLDMNIQPKNGS